MKIIHKDNRYFIKCDCGFPGCEDEFSIDDNGSVFMGGRVGVKIINNENSLTHVLPPILSQKILAVVKSEFEKQSA